MPPAEVSGLHYDKVKGKYFKVLKNHLAPPGSPYSKDAIKKENESSAVREVERAHQQVKELDTIRRSKVVEHPLLGGMGLEKEIAQRRSMSSSGIQAWATGLESKKIFEYKSYGNINHFVFDEATGGFAFTVNNTMNTAAPRRFQGSERQAYTIRSGSAMYSEVSSMALSPSRVLMTVGRGGQFAANIHIHRLVSPERLNRHGDVSLMRDMQISNSLINDISISLRQNGATFWACAPRPSSPRSDFALATSKGTFLIVESEGAWDFGPFQQFGTQLNRCRSTKEVLAVDWMGVNLVLNGFRDGAIRLWDVRVAGTTGGTSLRLRHPSTISHVRRLHDHSVIVAGLQDQLCAYDTRYLPSSKRSPGAGLTTPSVVFPAYEDREDGAIGFDVCSNFVAASTIGPDGERVRMFDAKSGRRIRGPLDQKTYAEAPTCLRIVNGEDAAHGPRLMVANKKVIEEWSW